MSFNEIPRSSNNSKLLFCITVNDMNINHFQNSKANLNRISCLGFVVAWLIFFIEVLVCVPATVLKTNFKGREMYHLKYR